MFLPMFTTGAATDESFQAFFEPHRRAITLHCYRMLGSLQDAEEIVQESLLRAWQRQSEAQPATFRPWLYRIATNACLDHLRKARRRRTLPQLALPASNPTLRIGPPTKQHLWIEPAPDSLLELADDAAERPDERVPLRESVGLAFITALQFLSPKQRAALLLVDVLEWKPQAAAELLETSLVSINSLLQRARRSVQARREAKPARVSSSDADLLRRFVASWESGDVEAFSALLAEDALFSMPPQPEWFSGPAAIGQFFSAIWTAQPGSRRLLPLAANGGPAVALYRQTTPNAPNAPFEPGGIALLTIRDARISGLTLFRSARLFPLFGLPNQPPTD